jgi:pimeloyl-ACP methyl ester carboxylesterase
MPDVVCQVRGPASAPTVIYLPGLHGEPTLVQSFGRALGGEIRFVTLEYPRSVTTTLRQLALDSRQALRAAGVDHGWLLAESFGSQVAWAWLEAGTSPTEPPFTVDGLILAGGFVRFPWPWLVTSTRHATQAVPSRGLGFLLWAFEHWARWWYPHAPEVRRGIEVFAARRREPGDREAMAHRLRLIREADLRPVARECRLPVWSLAGRWDSVVPMPWVHRWLRRNCPGFRGAVTLGGSDHVVLACQPDRSAEVVRGWVHGQISYAPRALGQTLDCSPPVGS